MEKMGIRKIPVHHKNGVVYALVDDDYDGEYIAQFKWHVNKFGYASRHDNEYELNHKTGETKRTKASLISMHVDILGRKEGLEIDHIDRNKLNNRSCNLRHVTHKENSLNKKQHARKSKRKYRGVQKCGKKYYAYIKGKCLGSSYDPSEAALLYDNQAKTLWGKDAVLNFPEKAIA